MKNQEAMEIANDAEFIQATQRLFNLHDAGWPHTYEGKRNLYLAALLICKKLPELMKQIETELKTMELVDAQPEPNIIMVAPILTGPGSSRQDAWIMNPNHPVWQKVDHDHD